MSIDIPAAVNTIEFVVPLGIFMFGGYMALNIARLFVGGIYKGRAYWTAALAGAALIFTLGINTSVPLLSYAEGTPVFPIIFLALLFFADSNLQVMKESDFFHRDIIRWDSLRRPVIIAMVATNAFVVCGLFLLPESTFTNPPPWVGIFLVVWFGYVGFVFTYSAAALIIGARRSADTSLKKYARMLGLSLLSFMLFFTIWLPLGYFGNFVSGAVSGFFMIPAAYYIYRAVTSLSPLGKIDRSEMPSIAIGPTPRT